MPRPPTPKVRNWGEADEEILYELIRSGAVDINDTSLENIEHVRRAHFQQRSSENFRRNFRNYAARLDLEEAYHGARQRAAEEGKLCVCFIYSMFDCHVIYLPFASSSPSPPPPPQEWR